MTNRQVAGFSGWRVLLALSFVFFSNMGFSQFGGAVMNAATVIGLHLDRRILGYVVLLTSIMYGLSGPVAAFLIRRIGIRRTIAVGSTMMAIGTLLAGTVITNGWQLALSASLFVGMGIGLSTQISAQAAVTAWFVRRRALAVSLVWTAAGVGGFIAPPLLSRITATSWRNGWLFMSALLFVTGIVAFFTVIDRPADVGQLPDGEMPVYDSLKKTDTAVVIKNWSLREAATTASFWIILFAALAQTATIFVYLAHGVLHLMDLGHSRGAAAFSVSIFAIGAVAGKLAAGVSADRIQPRYVWSVGAACMAVAIFLLTGATANSTVYVCSILLGVGNGISLVCWPTILANYFGAGNFAAIMGSQVPVASILGALAPLAAGVAYDAHHSYGLVFSAVAAISAASAFALLMAARPSAQLPQRSSLATN
jgi:MFS family permease